MDQCRIVWLEGNQIIFGHLGRIQIDNPIPPIAVLPKPMPKLRRYYRLNRHLMTYRCGIHPKSKTEMKFRKNFNIYNFYIIKKENRLGNRIGSAKVHFGREMQRHFDDYPSSRDSLPDCAESDAKAVLL
jgi:hypothetical protein